MQRNTVISVLKLFLKLFNLLNCFATSICKYATQEVITSGNIEISVQVSITIFTQVHKLIPVFVEIEDQYFQNVKLNWSWMLVPTELVLALPSVTSIYTLQEHQLSFPKMTSANSVNQDKIQK